MLTTITWIVAAKITWRVQGHHLGARIGQDGGVLRYQGFLQKVVGVRTIEGCDFKTNEGIQRVYKIVHPASTRLVTAHLYPEYCHMIRHVYPVPGRAGSGDETNLRVTYARGEPVLLPSTHNTPFRWQPHVIPNGPPRDTVGACMTHWISPRFMMWHVTDDVKLRLPTFSAGFAPVADTKVGLDRVYTAPIAMFMPYQQQIPALQNLFTTVAASPLQYGKCAPYLVVNAVA